MNKNNYFNFIREPNYGTHAYIAFKSEGKENDIRKITEAVELAYNCKVSYLLNQDDYGTIGITFSGLKENMDKLEEFYCHH